MGGSQNSLSRLAQAVTRHWFAVIVIWLLMVALVRLGAPAWDSITHDGDFAYLPAHMRSVVGEQWMSQAFPRQRGRSQIVVAIARSDAAMTNDDIHVGYDVARRMKNLFGAARLAAARSLRESDAGVDDEQPVSAEERRALYDRAIEQARDALDEALTLDILLADYWNDRIEQDPSLASARPPRLPQIYHNKALLDSLTGDAEAAAENSRLARQLDEAFATVGEQVLPEGAADLPLVDAWTWREAYFGDKLVSQDNHVRLIILQLTNEFMEVDNVYVLNAIEAQLAPVRANIEAWTQPGLSVLQS